MKHSNYLAAILCASLMLPSLGFAALSGDDGSDASSILDEILTETKNIKDFFSKYYGKDNKSPSINSEFNSDNKRNGDDIAKRAQFNSYNSSEKTLTDYINSILLSTPTGCKTADNSNDPAAIAFCDKTSYSTMLNTYSGSQYLPTPYKEGRISQYNFSQGYKNKDNSILLSPSLIFGHTQYPEKVRDVVHLYSDYLVPAWPTKLPGTISDISSEKSKRYFLALRTYATLAALLKSNMLDAIELRTQPKQSNNEDAKSPLSIEEEMVTRRIKRDKSGKNWWRDSMEKARPEAVQKEVAYLLAEMNYQLYLNRRMNEKILATLTGVAAGTMRSSNPEIIAPDRDR
jgi:hypothetical protein